MVKRRREKKRYKRNIERILAIIVFDIVLAGIGLVIFSFFHHVLPQSGGAGVALEKNPGQSDVYTITLVLQTSLSENKENFIAEGFLKNGANLSDGEFEMIYTSDTLEYIDCSAEEGVSFSPEDGRLVFSFSSPGEKLFSCEFRITGKLSDSPAKFVAESGNFVSIDGKPVVVKITDGTETETPEVSDGDFSRKFSDKFTGGEIVKTENTYISQNVNVKLENVRKTVNGKQISYFVADIYVSSVEYFRTGFAKDTYGRGYSQDIEDFSQQKNAILAVNGDYYGARAVGVVVRNGVYYRGDLYEDVLVLWNDGVMETFEALEFDFDTVQAQHGGIWQAWSFGPELLDSGVSKTSFNSKVIPSNPRSAVGYYEPGHYCIVVVDGRQSGYSEGLRMEEISELFAELGCKVAYNLDGGQSSVLTWDGKLANSPYKGGRTVSDFIYIPEE